MFFRRDAVKDKSNTAENAKSGNTGPYFMKSPYPEAISLFYPESSLKKALEAVKQIGSDLLSQLDSQKTTVEDYAQGLQIHSNILNMVNEIEDFGAFLANTPKINFMFGEAAKSALEHVNVVCLAAKLATQELNPIGKQSNLAMSALADSLEIVARSIPNTPRVKSYKDEVENCKNEVLLFMRATPKASVVQEEGSTPDNTSDDDSISKSSSEKGPS